MFSYRGAGTAATILRITASASCRPGSDRAAPCGRSNLSDVAENAL
jgi:hypothetical protein